MLLELMVGLHFIVVQCQLYWSYKWTSETVEAVISKHAEVITGFKNWILELDMCMGYIYLTPVVY